LEKQRYPGKGADIRKKKSRLLHVTLLPAAKWVVPDEKKNPWFISPGGGRGKKTVRKKKKKNLIQTPKGGLRASHQRKGGWGIRRVEKKKRKRCGGESAKDRLKLSPRPAPNGGGGVARTKKSSSGDPNGPGAAKSENWSEWGGGKNFQEIRRVETQPTLLPPLQITWGGGGQPNKGTRKPQVPNRVKTGHAQKKETLNGGGFFLRKNERQHDFSTEGTETTTGWDRRTKNSSFWDKYNGEKKKNDYFHVT